MRNPELTIFARDGTVAEYECSIVNREKLVGLE